MRLPHVCAGIALAASLTVLGCGETTIDTDKAETFIAKTVGDQAGVRVKSVSCPDDVKAKKGDTFNCQVIGRDNTRGMVVVRQRDDEGNVNVSAPFLHTRDAETAIAAQIKQQTKATVTVTCPEIFVPRAGGMFNCQATDGQDARTVAVTTTDATGKFTFKVVP